MGRRILLGFFLFIRLNLYGQADTALTFSEIMFYPNGSNNEFIEIFNLSNTDSVDLTDYKIIYSTNAADIIMPVADRILPPKSYAVVFEGDYDFSSGIYNSLIPFAAVIYKINNSSFGTSGMANTSNRPVYLLNKDNDTIDVYTYSANNSIGVSDEKKILSKDNSNQNWLNSIFQNGTPGKKNSAAPFENNVTILSVNILPEQPKLTDTIYINSVIKNSGSHEQKNISIKFYYDENNDKNYTSDELLNNLIYPILLPNDTAEISFKYIPSEIKHYDMAIIASPDSDENALDNQLVFEFDVMPPDAMFNDIVINEIMYSPINDEPEWIELFNKSDKQIDFSGWKIKDRTMTVQISDSSSKLAANDFIIIARDNTITDYYDSIRNYLVINLPSLNNTDDEIVILDAYSNVIDSLFYKSTWGGTKGISLERIDVNSSTVDSVNWKSCVSENRATPGVINSVVLHENDLIIHSFTKPKTFYRFNDEILIGITIKNVGRDAVNNFSIKIHIDQNKNGIIDYGEEKSIYDFNLNNGLLTNDTADISMIFNKYQLGQNNLILQIIGNSNEYKENNFAHIFINVVEINVERNGIVINELMYSPATGQPEWVEIYNRSQNDINLKNFQIADKTTKNKIKKENYFIKTGEMIVIAKDSSINNYYEIPKFIIAAFPSLNFDEDKVILLDSLDRVIDSVYYFAEWGGGTGKSLERIDVENYSNDKNNWGSSTDLLKATPGKRNSIAIHYYDAEISSITFIPKKPDVNSQINISTLIKNIGKNILQFSVSLYEADYVDTTQKNIVEKSNLITLAAQDSLQYNFSYTKIMSGKTIWISVVLDAENDEVSANNFKVIKIHPSFKTNSTVINEIMYSPTNGEPEWFEIYNKSEYPVDLYFFSVTDVLNTPAKNMMTTQSVIVPPHEYIVVAKDSSIFNYHAEIKSKVIISNFANLNNDFDGIVIKDFYDTTIDSVFYKSGWSGKIGISLERKSVTSDSNDSSNWASSTDVEFSTPGRANSMSQKKYDLEITEVTVIPKTPIANENISVSAKIRNIGGYAAENFSISFELMDILGSRIIHTAEIQQLDANDSIAVNTASFNIHQNVRIIVSCNYKLDENNWNNVDTTFVYLSSQKHSIVISEFMPYPDSNKSEWIELLNLTEDSIDISNWKIADLLPTQFKKYILGIDLIIHPQEYFVIAADTSLISKDIKKYDVKFGSLGNIEDGLILLDANENVVDSLNYTTDIKIIKGKSLERKYPINYSDAKNILHYSLAESGNTIGKINSLEKIELNSNSDIVINEIMFDPSINNSEFVEFFNNSDDTVNIGGWLLSDNFNQQIDAAETSIFILPQDYLVIAADSLLLQNHENINSGKIYIPLRWISLTNEEKGLKLSDLWGNFIDSVFYYSDWHNKTFQSTKNISLERINPRINSNDRSNWSSSVSNSGATPCEKNSIFTDVLTTSEKLSIEPNPFSPDNDGYEDFTFISIKLKSEISQLRIKIFDDKGRLRRTLLDNMPVSSSPQIIFDGCDNNGRMLNVGMYIVLVESFDSQNRLTDTMKKVVVIAMKL